MTDSSEHEQPEPFTLSHHDRVLLVGESGTGKSTYARALISASSAQVRYICADPGRPAFAAPGLIGRATLGEDRGWDVEALVSIASMDCARYRAPLLGALRQLLPEASAPLIIDAPGIHRGVAADELILGIAQTCAATRVILLVRDLDKPLPTFARLLEASGFDLEIKAASPLAKRPSDGLKHTQRLDAWQTHISTTPQHIEVKRAALTVAGLQPEQHDWHGRIVGLLDSQGQTLGQARAITASATTISLECAPGIQPDQINALLVRDLGLRGEKLRTLTPSTQPKKQAGPITREAPRFAFTPREKNHVRIHLGEGPLKQGGTIKTTIVGELFEDPMIVLRLDHRQRNLFFDLGEVRQVPTRIVHQATDIMVTHCHLDHFGDFPWLLRRLVGTVTPLRIFGPPGLAERVDNMVHAFTWDRIGERGPRFEVLELHDDERLERWFIQCGIDGRARLETIDAPGGVILDEAQLQILATTLDHGGIPTIAYAVMEENRYSVRGNILRERGWRPGKWLGDLKKKVAERDLDAVISVETATEELLELPARELRDELLIPTPGQKIVYATDFAGSEDNRARVLDIARDADVFICESSFTEADRQQAELTGHMCARDAAAIARDANVNLMVPMHLSIRYEHDPAQIYREILEVFDKVHVPKPILDELLDGA